MFATASARLVRSRWAPWALLLLSVSAHVVVSILGAGAFKMIDLQVYVDGAAHLTDGRLYDFLSGSSHLPFTYPPFSALVFTPLHWLPWTFTRVVWQLGSIASVAAIIYLTLRLLGRAGPSACEPLASLRGLVVTATALAMWLEPIRTTFNYGQINLFLAVLVLGGAVSGRNYFPGATVGLAAGIKLVPAVTGLYYLLQRRFTAAAWAVAIFGATVAVMALLIPHDTWRYFGSLILDPSRTGPVFSAINQSWRGVLSRFAGHDVTSIWLVLCLLTAALGLWAARCAIRAGDRTAALLAIQVIGLLVSPISWSHHWVWVLPVLLWCLYGPGRSAPAVRILLVCWAAATYGYLVPVLVALQGQDPVNSRPGWQTWAGTLYVVIGVATLIVVMTVSRHEGRPGPVAGAAARGTPG